MLRREFMWGGLAAAVAGAMSSSARADLYDDYLNSVSKKPFVAFLARDSDHTKGKPGHAYVGIGVELDNGETVYERLLGYYPKDSSIWGEIKAVFTDVSGNLGSLIDDVAWSVEYRVYVDDTQRANAIAVADRWRTNDPKYNLFANGGKNCSSFVSEVGKAIGLKLPSDDPGLTWPVNYITHLRDANT